MKKKGLFNIIKYNFSTLLGYKVIYTILLSFLIIPVFYYSFSLLMNVTNYPYLTLDNIKYFLINPLTIIYVILAILVLALITIFDMANLVIIFDASYNNKKISIINLIKLSFNKCKKLFKIKNILVIFYILFLIPVLNITLNSSIISSFNLPEFIMDYINANPLYSFLYFLVYLFLAIIFFRWLFSIHYMIIEEKSFKESRISSKNLIKGNYIKDIIKVILVQIIFSVIFVIILLLSLFIILMVSNLFSNNIIAKSIAISISMFLIVLILLIILTIANGFEFALISKLFYKHKLSNKEKIMPVVNKDDIKKHTKIKIIIAILFVLVISIGSVFTYQVLSGDITINIENVKIPDVSAHRGASIKYPENTMSAFIGAKELGAEWIELDVVQTKDEQIVVSHDLNLSRTAKVNKNIIDLTYDEIKELEVGSFFDEKYNGEKIPLLSEVLDYASKNNIKLNIELKPTGKEQNFEKKVLDLINEYDFKDRCVVASLNYNAIKNAKIIDPNIKTLYIMALALGDVTKLEYVDYYSIEASNITEEMVSKVHNAGKEIYAWTINTEESITKMIDLGVDNIITDNIELAKEIVSKNINSDLINSFIELIK